MKKLLLILTLIVVPVVGVEPPAAQKNQMDRKHAGNTNAQPEVKPTPEAAKPATGWKAIYNNHATSIWIMGGVVTLGMAGWIYNRCFSLKHDEPVAQPDEDLAAQLKPYLVASGK
jgi:hypothetical protein